MQCISRRIKWYQRTKINYNLLTLTAENMTIFKKKNPQETMCICNYDILDKYK